jgi:hypothetical protein
MSATNRSNALTIDPTPAGMLALGRTIYTVHAIVDFGEYQSLAAKSVAVVCGKRGAKYLLTDNGAKYLMTVWNISEATKGWGGRAPTGNPWARLGGFRDRAAVMNMLGREGK